VQGGRWVSVGRLDLNTGGLLIFTTNGELANRLTHPRFEVEREYAVRVMGEVSDELKEKLLKTGVDIEGENCTFDSIEDRGGEGSNHWYHVVLREGKNREVRKMFEAVGLMVSRLMRVRFGPVTLPGHVKRGMVREMEEEQVQELLAFAGMNEPAEGEARSEEEDDELENIGNRIQDHREPKVREIDDDIGNKVSARAQAAPPEPDGNRGTYNPNAGERPPKAGPRRPHGQGKPFGFKKRAPGQGQPHQGQPHHAQGQGQPHVQGQGQPHGQGQGQGRHRHRKHGQQGNVAGNAQPAQGQPNPQAGGNGNRPPGQEGPPGAAKPGRNRRHKNRNRNRGAQEARGDQQPQNNGNREP
jgi:23S rRNA pseudouridine2605 synthase